MKIIIVGGGKVGHQIGKKLTNEKHDVVIIDDDPDVLARISDEMDVFALKATVLIIRFRAKQVRGLPIF